MPTMGYRQYKNGMLGQTVSPTLVKNQGRISLLSQEGPTGTQYTVLIDYGEVTQEQIFPTIQRKAIDGSQHYTTNSGEAFSQFDALAAMYGGITTDDSGINPMKVGSHDELDALLLSSAELPADITVELQRRGISASGRPKRFLNLEYDTSLFTKILGPKNDALRIARIHYESFPKETRIGALRDLRDRVAAKYLTSELLSSMLMSDRVKREAYQELLAQQNIDDLSALPNFQEYLATQPTVSAVPLMAFRVRFVDQNGNEISGLPYEASVRGVLNYKEAIEMTNGGANPGNFSSGKLLTEQGMSDFQQPDTANGNEVSGWTGRSLSPNHEYHLLYPYRVRSKGGTPRGTVKISITTPRSVSSPADWGNDRLKVYEQVANASETRDANIAVPQPKMLLYAHNYKLEEGGEPERIQITVPVHIEPLPMHLVESPPGSGNIVSKWSIADDMGSIPSHQKIPVAFTVLRPKASEKWEEADAILPDTRDGYMDKFLQYSEFTSPQGRAAYREAEREASPVRGIRFALMPDANNTWETGKQPIFMTPDGFGVMRAEVVPGHYNLKMLVEIRADGTTGLRLMTSSRDPEYQYGSRFDSLSQELQAAVTAKYPDWNIKRWTRFVPETIELGRLEAPAAFYYRKVTEEDTTPVGAVGVKLIKTGSIQDSGSSRFRNFELKSKIPALLPGKEAELGSAYDVLYNQYQAINGGWPGPTTETDETIFDTATILLSPDSTIDLSMISQYEQRYEAERAGGEGITPRFKMPAVGQRVGFMGYWIEHVWFDSAVGPELVNPEVAFAGGVHQYNMGRLETPFYDEGVLRLLCYYPQSGVMRRKMVVKSDVEPNRTAAASATYSYSRYNRQNASADRVFHFQVEAGPEGAILSGRWCPMEVVGLGSVEGNNPELAETIFNSILDEIRRGGGPLNPKWAGGALPKWNEFWTTTMDGWLFGGNDPGAGQDDTPLEEQTQEDIFNAQGGPVTSAPVTNTPVGVMPSLSTLQGTQPKFMDEQGDIEGILHAPNPSYNEEDEEGFGFIGGGF